jgi:hypothetical protein
VRLSFVDHGTDLNEEGAQSLADKVKILQQTYGTDSTDIERIALVGCSTQRRLSLLVQWLKYLEYYLYR